MYKLAIVGSRNFNDKVVFDSVLKEILMILGTPDAIISGGADGADTLAAEWALENNIKLIKFEPKHKDFPKKSRRWMAPKERNTAIVENSDVLLAFWDMKSTGTKDTVGKALLKGIRIYLYHFTEGEILTGKNDLKLFERIK